MTIFTSIISAIASPFKTAQIKIWGFVPNTSIMDNVAVLQSKGIFSTLNPNIDTVLILEKFDHTYIALPTSASISASQIQAILQKEGLTDGVQGILYGLLDIPVYILIKQDGTIKSNNGKSTIEQDASGNVTINASGNVTINASTVTVNGNVELGASGGNLVLTNDAILNDSLGYPCTIISTGSTKTFAT